MKFGGVVRAFELLMLVGSLARRIRGGAAGETTGLTESPAERGRGGVLETRLPGLLIAALKEAFNRDNARLDLERERLEAERQRAEQAQRLELRRQAIEREVGRLRLLALVALVGWIASVVMLAFRLGTASSPARTAVAAGWFLLLASLASAFSAQRRLGADVPLDAVSAESGDAGAASLWLLVAGLASSAVSLLL
jgi:hypothetical protein